MNIYYLKRFRKRAYKAIRVQYYEGAGAYSLEWRDSGELVKPLRYHIDLEKAKKDLQEVRRTYILAIIKNKRSMAGCNKYERKYDNKKLAKL